MSHDIKFEKHVKLEYTDFLLCEFCGEKFFLDAPVKPGHDGRGWAALLDA